MNKKELVLIWFDIQGVTFSRLERIISNFDEIDDIFNKQKIKSIGFDNEAKFLIEKLQNENLTKFEDKITKELEYYNVVPLTIWSDNYPDKLKVISEPPLVLYTKGNISLLNEKSISIVGTRKPTTYGKIVCEKFTKELSGAGLVTVSGLAYGIDTVVAEKTLEANGKTIAVLAGGLDSIYPAQNNGLAQKIIQAGGLLVSEHYIGTKPINFQFVRRNRIVSALGLGTLIVEAGKHSGTMTTANFALDQSKDLFVVPGNITSPQSEGTNSLIDQMPDIFTISPSRILFKYGIKKQESPKSQKQVDMIESSILDLLSQGSMSFDDLCEKTNLPASMLSSKLIKMEMFGLVKKGSGNLYFKL